MQNLNKAFVIVEPCAGSSSYIKEHISFKIEELEKKCDKMNEEKNAVWKENHEKLMKKKKNVRPFVPSVVYVVTDLATAIENLKDMVYDENRIEDESY